MDLSLEAADRIQLVGQAWTPPGPVRGVVYVVHGLKDHSLRYEEVAQTWAVRGYAVVAFDLRGHGRSGGPPAYARRFSLLLDDLDQELSATRGRWPNVPILLMGHSLGGAVVALRATRPLAGVRGIILSAPALQSATKVSGGARAFLNFLSAVAPRTIAFRPKNSDFSRDPRVVEAMDHDPRIHQKGVPARTMAELLRAMEAIRASAGRLTVPVLLLHGTADRLTSPAGSERLLTNCGAADKKLIPYPGLYHDLLHEPERAIVASDIVTWMDRHSVS